MVHYTALALSLAVTAVAVVLFARTVAGMVAVVRLGQPTLGRTDDPGARTMTLVRETLGHTRMLQWARVGFLHWFLMVGFGLLFATLVTAYGQLFDAHFVLPLIGHFPPFEWLTELFAWAMVLSIVPLIAYRATRPKQRVRGPAGRFWGSTMWQGYFVELVILGVGLCILTLRGLEYAMARFTDRADTASALHFPLTAWLGQLFTGLSESTLAQLIWIVAALKILISMAWLLTLALNPTMGVAWHRFTVWPNIWFKRKAGGGPSLGAAQPMLVGGKPVDFETIDELDEDAPLGVGKVEDFTWKGLLDFSTCTECGRCQSQCPAWNTDKPLSPKLLITNLRDHAYAKAPLLLAPEGERASLGPSVHAEAERPLVGATEGDPSRPTGGAVIDPEVLWSCTTCGACVQQCPVDIEHVDHVVDMRRYQVLIESSFPQELNSLFKGLETKGNPWSMSPSARLDWAKGLDFPVRVVGQDVEDLSEVEWLFWVGCAGAYEDRAKKTTRAVAELLHTAGVSFAVLGDGETCSGDPARRAGNEFVFQQLAMENAEVLKESRATKVVSTCAHCFNTLKNEYGAFGVELEVVHHTQLLNRLVREGKLTPVPDAGGPTRTITYHDPCYLGRHNQVYTPPRDLLEVIPSTRFTEMPRNSERSFCCGGGGARMWMEERTGERINVNRITEAVETGADQVATGCPFCRVMLSDGLTAKQAEGSARNEVEVLDVAQLLLDSVKRVPVGATAGGGGSIGSAGPAGQEQVERPVDVGPAAGATRTGETGTASATPGAETEPPDAAATDLDARDLTSPGLSAAESRAPADDAAVRAAAEDDGPRET
ncbi:MAG: Fe-S oxidoreductase [uncultured Nocardioidaceae bacterium]|uniref:Fe-S oxidoreductase n=1 Tax=uncultured Nocardioidaceae bacterium TaxID=253824 RepID=A0A6J4KTP8_9ACTN|nr:MAG: Fe-S oxidoreductase [uncultured Nocardioidaceae bacterium]